MSIDRESLSRAIAARGPVIRVVVADVAGSAPREAGTAMLVWAGGQDGTIGGGALEYEAAALARAMLAAGRTARLDRMPLGPALNQCCGGAVTILSERWDEDRLAGIAGQDIVARPLPGTGGEMPMAVARILKRARGEGFAPSARIVQGWFVEPVAKAARDLWIWGAGHVGRAIVDVMRPLPGFRLTWADTEASRFPPLPEGVAQRIATNPADLVPEAPEGADHLVLTFSHALDLDLCHRLLTHGFGSLGLIGSETKWARFRSRLAALGHAPDRVADIRCPIGDPRLGKEPQAIAIGVAAELMTMKTAKARTEKERAG
ncbi:xanthine dehydrogenase accessory protein XdhC [Albidovulum sp.]|uniref:xanthine dehydrogenase accessory protein XdhC n=1 Tax=Albidovulum sp. TaxID=1872424 RepID=UPI001DB2F320|nr:xanthine dehydrogenase accessory protein XdhC [Paracoccaceae bacterium]MCB2138535.1 xanthine dehydrogenase accessory protein XdhC [Paracoccaceae bacterium]MCB2157655.1 xanthine dehydrogenase accessory protein XdhC [Paracoccaceae bacterium]HPE26915.1 xanthine dehydrogenase accessory protein XdhC [Albidovulum sp.]